MTALRPRLCVILLEQLARQVAAAARIAQKKINKAGGKDSCSRIFALSDELLSSVQAATMALDTDMHLGAPTTGSPTPGRDDPSWANHPGAGASSSSEEQNEHPRSNSGTISCGVQVATGTQASCDNALTHLDPDAGHQDVPQALIESLLQDRLECIVPVLRQELIAAIMKTSPKVCHADILRRDVASHPRLASALLRISELSVPQLRAVQRGLRAIECCEGSLAALEAKLTARIDALEAGTSSALHVTSLPAACAKAMAAVDDVVPIQPIDSGAYAANGGGEALLGRQ